MSSTISLVFVVIGLLATLSSLAVVAIVLRRSAGRERAHIPDQGTVSPQITAETQRQAE